MTKPSEIHLTQSPLTAKEALVSVISHPLKAQHYGSSGSQPEEGKEDMFPSNITNTLELFIERLLKLLGYAVLVNTAEKIRENESRLS